MRERKCQLKTETERKIERLRRERNEERLAFAFGVTIAIFGAQALLTLWLWMLGWMQVSLVSVVGFALFVSIVVVASFAHGEATRNEDDM